MSDTWMHPRLTDYWDEHVRSIDAAALRLAALSKESRADALQSIAAAVTEHVRVMPDDVLVQATVVVADDLYRAACAADRWDDALHDYLVASAGTMCSLLGARGFVVQYLVDNAWEDLTKPVRLLPHWYGAAGFVYACPAAVACELAESDGLSPDIDMAGALEQRASEAHHVVDELLRRCQSERRHVMQLDTDSTAGSFSVALGARDEAGVITVLRDAAPEPATQVAVWLPRAHDL